LATRPDLPKGISMQVRMKVVKGKPQGHFLSFPAGEFIFGRGPECDVRPNSDLVSRQHCLIQITKDWVLVRDLGSRNGTLVNGQLVMGERKLDHGDTLQLGPLILELVFDAETAEIGNVSISDTALINQDETTTNQPIAAPPSPSSVAAIPTREFRANVPT
jgi:pSer/pThr/pTyr-binding forkhead associated (FHA) protein